MLKTVLVSGANGFVGQHLVNELAKDGKRVVAIGGGPQAAGKNKHVSDYLTLDLRKSSDAKKIPFGDVDAVIHLAGLAAVGPSFDNPLEYVNTNMGIEINLFEAALTQKASPRFLIISSGSLYDPKAPLPLTETSSVQPTSPYAVSKLGQEQLAKYYVGRGFECIIARPFNHCGPGQGPGFLVPDLVKQVVDIERHKIDKLLVGNLEARRDYTDVRDIVRAYDLLIEKGQSGSIYNVCSGVSYSGQEILDEILKLASVDVKIERDPSKMRPADNPLLYGSHEKLTLDTGWKPEIPINTTLSDVLNYWRAQD